MGTQFASDVEGVQLDLSQILVNNTITLAAYIVRSRRGKVVPTLNFSDREVIQNHGKPNYEKYGVSLGASLVSMRQTGAAYYVRAVGAGAAYAALVLGIVTPPALTVPVASTASLVAGGILTAATYSYRVAAYNANGETQVGTAVTQVISGGDVTAGNKSVSITIPQQTSATGYAIYGRTGAAEKLIARVAQGTTTFVDDGSLTPDVGIPFNSFLYTGEVESTVITPILATVATPTDFDFVAFKAAYELAHIGSTIKVVGLFYAVGPGDYANTEIALQIVSTNLNKPAAPTATLAAGGTLAAGTYSYRVSAINQNGETQAGPKVLKTITSTNVTAGNKSIILNIPQQEQATGYSVYGRTDGAEKFLGHVAQGTTTFTDDGSLTPDVSIPVNTYPYTVDPTFQVRVYDTLVAATVAQETYQCTVKDYIDGFNNNLEVGQQITDVSPRVSFYSNALVAYPDGSTLPTVTSAAKSFLTLGAEGAAPGSTEVAQAWSLFQNRDIIRINMLIDLGWSSKVVADAMRTIADIQRAQFLCDVPINKQSTIGAISYRKNDLALDTRRGCLFTPWLKWNDPYVGGTRILPPATFAAQRMLFTDALFSAGRSAAGLNRGITDSVDVSDKNLYRYTDAERDQLAKAQVNYFRVRSQGVVLWEQWTLQQQFSAASFINVNRIWDIIQNSIDDFLEYDLQEPNDDFLAKQIVGALTGYLNEQVIARNLNAFAVYADERAENTSQSLSEGRRNVDVYLTPTLATRRIRCRTILTAQGATFENLLTV